MAAALIVLCGASRAAAQEIEPRAYANAPVGVNFLIAGYVHTEGGVTVDRNLPVENPALSTSSGLLAYARILDIGGLSGKLDVVLPYTFMSGKAELDGRLLRREVHGLGDARFRLSVNLLGAPAVTTEEFAAYEQDLIVGVSLQVAAPTGRYDSSRLVNIGTNRWAFRPEIGISKRLGNLTLEGMAAVHLYTDNDEFFGERTRAQAPIFSAQGHAIYRFGKGVWASTGLNYFVGGRTTVDGTLNADLQQNWRLGGTLAVSLDRRNSIKLDLGTGLAARTGNDLDLVGIAFQRRWGGGL